MLLKNKLLKLNNLYSRKPLLKTNNIKGSKNSSGRNNSGKITSFNKGGGHKKKYRKIDFKRDTDSIGIVTSIEYDPNRTSNIASVFDFYKSTYFYILATNNMAVGDIIKSGLISDIKSGHSIQLIKVPVGTLISNIALKEKSKAQISRSAGTFSTIIEVNNKFCKIQLTSGKQKRVSSACFCTIGIVSNQFFFLQKLKKAGRSRWLNKRPKVRGVAMNPIDHPHGGGEGKTSGKKFLSTPWGKPTKGIKTAKSKHKWVDQNGKDLILKKLIC
uniref:Ribosomal protein L2 n=1 Tax=Lithodesmium undulatum TaxID=59812 RepID=A0A7T6UZP3_LITUN|nr:ribosomal protein L2 [Lithodesmium undulatum]QQJ94657.1 ribosomal protein L2 [Lithodesmium undulatum]